MNTYVWKFALNLDILAHLVEWLENIFLVVLNILISYVNMGTY
jgi:hypothetical protein